VDTFIVNVAASLLLSQSHYGVIAEVISIGIGSWHTVKGTLKERPVNRAVS